MIVIFFNQNNFNYVSSSTQLRIFGWDWIRLFDSLFKFLFLIKNKMLISKTFIYLFLNSTLIYISKKSNFHIIKNYFKEGQE